MAPATDKGNSEPQMTAAASTWNTRMFCYCTLASAHCLAIMSRVSIVESATPVPGCFAPPRAHTRSPCSTCSDADVCDLYVCDMLRSCCYFNSYDSARLTDGTDAVDLLHPTARTSSHSPRLAATLPSTSRYRPSTCEIIKAVFHCMCALALNLVIKQRSCLLHPRRPFCYSAESGSALFRRRRDQLDFRHRPSGQPRS